MFTSSLNSGRTKEVIVVTTPKNKLRQDKLTNAELGTSKNKLDGYMSGMAERLDNSVNH